jgi:hypothetical protein
MWYGMDSSGSKLSKVAGPFVDRNEIFLFHKRRRISWTTGRLLASQGLVAQSILNTDKVSDIQSSIGEYV